MIQIHAIEKQQHALLIAMQSFLIKVLLVTLCMYKSVHLIFFKSVDGSESCGIEMDFPMLFYFCFFEFH